MSLHGSKKKAHLPMAELFFGRLEEDGVEVGTDFVVLSRLWADGRVGSGVASF